jgi:serine/threonine protein phosphatase PrpC
MTRRSRRGGEGVDSSFAEPHTSSPASVEGNVEHEPFIIESAHRTVSTKGNGTRNEDCFVDNPDNGFFAVIDGMGGYENGKEAAEVVRDYLNTSPDRPRFTAEDVSDFDVVANKFRTMFTAADSAVHGQYPGAGAVGVVAEVVDTDSGKKLIAGWVGDSRLYYFFRKPSGDISYFVSTDNFDYRKGSSERQQYLDDQRILSSVRDQQEIFDKFASDQVRAFQLAAAFKNRNEVHDYFGHSSDSISFDYGIVDIKAGDVALLFSDGVHDNLMDWEIGEIVQKNYEKSVDDIIGIIVNAAAERSQSSMGRKKRDDITAVGFRLPPDDQEQTNDLDPVDPLSLSEDDSSPDIPQLNESLPGPGEEDSLAYLVPEQSGDSSLSGASEPIIDDSHISEFRPNQSETPEQFNLTGIDALRTALIEKRSALHEFGITESDIAAIQKRIHSGIAPVAAINTYLDFSAFNVFMPLTRSVTIRGAKKQEASSLLRQYFDSYEKYTDAKDDRARSLWQQTEARNLLPNELALRRAEIFEELVVNEHQKLLKQSTEQLPIRDRNIIGSLFDWWRGLSLWKRTLINTAIATGVFAALSPGIGTAGIIAYGASRGARGLASTFIGQTASKFVKLGGDRWVEKRYEHNVGALMDTLRTPGGLADFDNFLTQRQREFEKLTQKRDTDRRLVTALALCFGAGAGFSAGIGLGRLDNAVTSSLFGESKPVVPVEHPSSSPSASPVALPAESHSGTPSAPVAGSHTALSEQYGPKLSSELDTVSRQSARPVGEFFSSESRNPVSPDTLAKYATVGQGGSAWGTVHNQLQYLLRDAQIAPDKLGLRLNAADLSDATKVRHALDVKTLEILKENNLMESGITRPGVQLNLSAFSDSQGKIHFRVDAPVDEKNPVFYKYTPERTSVPVQPPIKNLLPSTTTVMPDERPRVAFNKRRKITQIRPSSNISNSSITHPQVVNPEAFDATKFEILNDSVSSVDTSASISSTEPLFISRDVVLNVVHAPSESVPFVQKFFESLHVNDAFARTHWNAFHQMSVGEFLKHLDEIEKAKTAGAGASPVQFTLDAPIAPSARVVTHTIYPTDPALQGIAGFFSTERAKLTDTPLARSLRAMTVEQYLLDSAQKK